MSSTNKTLTYELPQWIGTDKPTFLGDLNDAFLKIDTGMTENKGGITGAESKAEQAVQQVAGASDKADKATARAEEAYTRASDAKNIADNATTVANNASATANNALNAVNEIQQDFGWVNGEMTRISTVTYNSFGNFISYNPTLNLMSIACRVTTQASAWNVNQEILTIPASIARYLPTDKKRIYGGLLIRTADGSFYPCDLDIEKVGDTGYIRFAGTGGGTGTINNPSGATIQLMLNTSRW